MKKNAHYPTIHNRLLQREKKARLRSLTPVSYENSKKRIVIDGTAFLNFCSNDYLGLSTHTELIKRSALFTERYGTSSSASRLVSGSLHIHHDLEEKIAGLYSAEACLLFGSGFQANVTILPALTGRHDLILADKTVHNSVIQGATLSHAPFRRFQHNDCDHLEYLLKNCRRNGDCWVVTESLFSMDGDRAPLNDISALCRRYGAYLMVDDAHAFGVFGENGLGLTEGRDDIDLVLGTFGKAGGGYGAFVLCSEEMKVFLVNYSSGVIYSTSSSPGSVGAADAAVDLIPGMDRERSLLAEKTLFLSDSLKNLGYETGDSRSQIIPVLLSNEEESVRLSRLLYEEKVFVQAIRPPTVKRSRLRLTLNAHHGIEEIKNLLEVLKNG
ncbi:MAG: 8-amino-7-oxononanoate synthase [Balneolaceae bacterium]